MKKPAALMSALAALPCLLLLTIPIQSLAAADTSDIKLPAAFKQAKAGLWEDTMESSRQGGPSAPDLGAMMGDEMAKMPPEAQAKLQAAMKKQMAGSTDRKTIKSCVTQERIDRASFQMPQDDRRDKSLACSFKEASRTANALTVNSECSGDMGGPPGRAPMSVKMHGTISVEIQSPTSVSTRLVNEGVLGSSPIKSETKVSSRWISADCGAVKPRRED